MKINIEILVLTIIVVQFVTKLDINLYFFKTVTHACMLYHIAYLIK